MQRWRVAGPADSRAALQHLVQVVRSQRFALVVLDSVPALAPPLPGAGVVARAARLATTTPAAAARIRVEGGQVAAVAGAGAGSSREAVAAAQKTSRAPAATPAARKWNSRSGPDAGTGAEAAVQGTLRPGAAGGSGQALTGAAAGDPTGALAVPQWLQAAAHTLPNYRVG